MVAVQPGQFAPAGAGPGGGDEQERRVGPGAGRRAALSARARACSWVAHMRSGVRRPDLLRPLGWVLTPGTTALAAYPPAGSPPCGACRTRATGADPAAVIDLINRAAAERDAVQPHAV